MSDHETTLTGIAEYGTRGAIELPSSEERAACLAGAEALRLVRALVEDGSPWDQYNECMFCGERWQNPRKHGKDCAWEASRALLTETPR